MRTRGELMRSASFSDTEIVDRTLRLMREPLAGFVQKLIAEAVREGLTDESNIDAVVAQIGYGKPIAKLDTRILLKMMERVWNPVFWTKPGKAGRSYAAELLFFSNAQFHQEDQKTFDTERFVDTAMRLLVECEIDLPDALQDLHRATLGNLKPPSETEPDVEAEGKNVVGVENLIRDSTAVLKERLDNLNAAVVRCNETLTVLLERGRKMNEPGPPSETRQAACTDRQAGAIFRLLLELGVKTSDDDAIGDALDDQRFDGSHIKTWCQQRYTKMEADKKIKELNRKVSESRNH